MLFALSKDNGYMSYGLLKWRKKESGENREQRAESREQVQGRKN